MNEDIEKQLLKLLECVVDSETKTLNWRDYDAFYEAEVTPEEAKAIVKDILDVFHSNNDTTYSHYFSILYDNIEQVEEVDIE